MVIGVLKELALIDDTGKPTDRYFRFIDQSKSATVLAEAIEEAYEDLFAVNRKANELSKPEIVGKFKTLSQGKYSDSVLDKMATTFLGLAGLADFENNSQPQTEVETVDSPNDNESASRESNNFTNAPLKSATGLGGLVYNIQIVLPETRDPKVYDALFRSLKEHLL